MGYYPGTAQYAIDAERRDRHQYARRQGLFDALAAIAPLISAGANVRRANQAQADDSLLAEHLSRALANPNGELPEGVSGPAMPPEIAAANEAASAQPPSLWDNILGSVSFGAAGGGYRPRLSSQGVLQIAQAAQGARGEQFSRQKAEADFQNGQRSNELSLWDKINQARNQAAGRRIDAGRLRLERQKWDSGAAGRLASTDADAALARLRDRTTPGATGGGGMSQASIESNYRIWDKRMSDAMRHLQTLKSFKDTQDSTAEDQRAYYRLQHGVSEDILASEIAHAQAELGRFADMRGGSSASPRNAPPPPANDSALDPVYGFGEEYAKGKGWNPDNLTDEQVNEILSALRAKQGASAK